MTISLLTIGHSNYAMDEFLSLLKMHNVKNLIDVRSKPYSKYTPHFSRDQLPNYLGEAGFEYFYGGKFLGGLGDLPVDHPMFVDKMQRILALAAANPTVLMCAERDPKQCHRAYKLSAWVLANYPQVDVFHIIPSKPLINGREFQALQKEGWVKVK